MIRGLLRDKIIVLVTHHLQYAESASKILAIESVSYYGEYHGFTRRFYCELVPRNHLQGNMKVYSSHSELQSKGIDLGELVKEPNKEEKIDEFAVRTEENGDEEREEEWREWQRPRRLRSNYFRSTICTQFSDILVQFSNINTL